MGIKYREKKTGLIVHAKILNRNQVLISVPGKGFNTAVDLQWFCSNFELVIKPSTWRD